MRRTSLAVFKYKVLVLALLGTGLIGLHYARRDLDSSKYAYDKIGMLTRFVAKEYCSCRFVVQQSEDYCQAYINAEIPLLGVRMHTAWITSVRALPAPNGAAYETQVISHAFGFLKGEARYYGENGCRLEP